MKRLNWMLGIAAMGALLALPPAWAGDNMDDEHSGHADEVGDGDSGQGNDGRKKGKHRRDDSRERIEKFLEKHPEAKAKWEKMSPEQKEDCCCKLRDRRERLKERLKDMEPAERKAFLEKRKEMREKVKGMSKEERRDWMKEHPKSADRMEDRRDRREDVRDRREDVRDRAEDCRDEKHDGGKRDRMEDRRDRREDVRDRKEDRRDRDEDRREHRRERKRKQRGCK